MKIVKYDEVKPDDLDFLPPKSNRYGGQSIRVLHDGSKLCIQTPKCTVPFQINKFENKGSTNYSIDISLKDDTIINFFNDFDEAAIKEAVNNSQLWFGKVLTETDIRSIFRKTVKQNGTYLPLMRSKIILDECDIFDINKEITSVDCIKPKSQVQLILECVGVYFVRKEFGITWKAQQIKVFPSDKLEGYAFISDDELEYAEKI